jgi:hypothetical protein
MVHVNTRMSPSVLSEAVSRGCHVQEDLRVLTPLLHDYVNP